MDGRPVEPVMQSVALPVARIDEPRKIGRWPVLIFVAVLGISLTALAVWRWHERGLIVTVVFPEAYDLRPGCKVKCRGAEVGKVLDISLSADLQAEVTMALHASKPVLSRLASASSRFWIVHPVVSTRAIEGLDAVLTRYVAVLPGEGTMKRRFIGLPQMPVIDNEDGGGTFELRSPNSAGLSAGAPVSYRGLSIGKVLSVEHLENANGVSIKAWIPAQYLPIVCEKTQWWKTGGAKFSMAISGISAEVGTLQSLFVGGVEFATPPARDAGSCHDLGGALESRRFTLHQEPEDDWLSWEPHITIGRSPLGQSAGVYSATLRWKSAKKEGSQNGLLLLTEQGLLGPANVLVAPENSLDGESTLTVGGHSAPWKKESVVWKTEALALYRTGDHPIGSSARAPALRAPKQIEDVVVYNEGNVPILVDREYLTPKTEGWNVDSGLPFSQAKWHGAAVISRSDNQVIGVMSIDHKDRARIIPLP